MKKPDNNEDNENEDEEGHGQADVEREVGGLYPRVGLRRILGVHYNRQVRSNQLRSAQPSGAVLTRYILSLAVSPAVGGGRGGAAPPPDMDTVRGAGAPTGPNAPGSVHGGTNPGAGFLLNRRTLAARSSVDRSRRITGSLSNLNTSPTLDITLVPLRPFAPAPGY